MKKHNSLKLLLAIAVAAALCVAVMVVSAFAADDLVTVDNEADFVTAFSEALTDGSVRTVKITGDFTITQSVSVAADTNVIVTSDDPYVITCDRPSGTQYSFFNIYAGASLTLTGKVTLHGVLENNRAIYARAAGASFVLEGDAIIENFSMSGSGHGGGILISNGASATINSGTIQGCQQTGTGRGGGIAAVAGSTLTINGGTIQNNSSFQGGGGVWAGGSGADTTTTFTMTGGTITGNKVTGDNASYSRGGGLAILAEKTSSSESATVNATITGGTITNNSTASKEGGGLAVWAFTSDSYKGTLNVTIKNITVSDNTAANAGGGIWIQGNPACVPGASLENVDSIGNTSSNYGGGIYLNTPVAMTNVNVFGNTAKGNGGGVYLSATSQDYTLGSGVTVAGNVCTGSGGGGVMTECNTLVIDGATIGGTQPGTSTPDPTGTRGNYSASQGGGLRIYKGAITVNSGTIINNTASTGGAIHICGTGSANITGGSFEGNTAGSGCGISTAAGASLALSGDLAGAGVDNFVYLADGVSIIKGGSFGWTGKMGVTLSSNAVDGTVIVDAGGETLTEEELAYFTTDPKAFPGYIAALTYAQDGVIALSLEEDLNAETVAINKTTSTSYFSLVTAIAEAADGDVIELQDNVNLSEQITITKSLTLTAKEGADITITKSAGGAGNGIFFCSTPSGNTGTFIFDGGITLDAGGNFTRAITSNSSRDTIVLNNVKLTGGTTYAVLAYGPVEINEGADIYGNGSGGSAAVYSSAAAANITMTGGKIHDNTSRGLYAYGGSTLNMTGGEIYNNTVTAASTSGGGLFSGYSNGAGAVLNISNAKIYDNTATGNGGAFYAQASVTLDKVEITGNTGAYGGGMYFGTASSVINITDSKINGNTALNEAGGFASGNVTSIEITDTEICGNTAKSVGGGFELYGQCAAEVTLTRVKIAGNTGSAGGAVYKGKASTLTLNDCTIGGTELGDNTPDATGTKGNFARSGAAGAIYSTGGVTTVNGGSFTGNCAVGVGGAIYCSGESDFTLDGVTVEDNHAIGGGGINSYAGAINIGSTTVLTINNCTVKGNTSNGGGGAMILNGTANINDTEITGNACGMKLVEGVFNAAAGYGGSAIYVDNAGQVELNNVTITGNGNGYAALYASRGDTAANSVTFDGKVVIKDNSQSIDNYNAETKVYEVGEEEEARGFYWAFGQAEKCNVRFKETLGADSDVILTLSSEAIGPEDTVFVGTSVDDYGLYSETDISAALAKFATLGGVTLVQSGSDVNLKNEGTITFTVVSANNGESRVYTPFNIGGEFKLPAQSAIVEDMTDSEVFDGYADKYFVGYAEVENYGTDNPTLKALYEEDNSTLTAEELSGKTLYAVWAFMETAPGASIKLSSEEGGVSGIRFVTLLETDTLAKIGIKDLTEEEWAAGDIGYRIGCRVTKDYGTDGAIYQNFVGAGGKTFTEQWFGDLLYDANYDDRGTNHAFSLGLALVKAQYEFVFTPRAFIQLQYTKGYNETHYADYPTELVDENPEPVVVKRSARQVAQAFTATLTDESNPKKAEEYLGLTEIQMHNLESLAGLTFDKTNKSFS